MKRRTLFKSFIAVGMIAALLAVGVGLYLFIRPSVVVTPELVERVQPGMTLAEVEAIFGAPSGDHSRGKSRATWQAITATVVFNAQERVESAHYSSMPQRPWYDRLWARFGY